MQLRIEASDLPGRTCGPGGNFPGYRALEERLAELLGEQAFQRSGLGAAPDTAALQERVGQLQQQVLDLERALEERDEELAAAREAHRRLMAEVNRVSCSQ